MKRRGIAANSALALAGDLASKVGALAVVLLAARLLAVGEFATVATGLAVAGILASAVDFGAGTLLARDGARSPASRGALFRALFELRLPLASLALAAAPLSGLWIGGPLTNLGVVALAVSSGLSLSVLGLYRSTQDVRPEAVQRLTSALASVLLVGLCGRLLPRADLVLDALAAASLLTLLPLLVRARSITSFERTVRPHAALRRGVPIGLLALATIAYYRSGTLALAALADSSETAAYSIAASLAFGLLMLPNAITTALLPRLSADEHIDSVAASARRTLLWTLGVAAPLSVAAAALGPLTIPLVLGSEYARAGVPFALLCAGIPLIATSGVIGTALLAIGRIRALGVQVVSSLLVNFAALAILASSFGAVGASLATLACEAVGLVLLVRAARTALPGLVSLQVTGFREPLEAGSAATR